MKQHFPQFSKERTTSRAPKKLENLSPGISVLFDFNPGISEILGRMIFISDI